MKREEVLAKDGKDGREACIIYDGNVYDVTTSPMWQNGVHMNLHKAGSELTDSLVRAPHGTEVLERVKHRGELEVDGVAEAVPAVETAPDGMQAMRDLYRKLHPHPMLIHFPIGVFCFSTLMQVIFLITGHASFELAAYYAVIFATVMSVPAIAAGIFSWRVNYAGIMSTIFRIKLFGSGLLVLFGIITISVGPSATFAYSMLLGLTTLVTMGIAYNGGKLTWPSG